MSYHQGNDVTSNRRGSFIGWTPPKKYQDTKSYYERLRDSTNGERSTDRRGSTRIAGGWEDVIQHGLSLPSQLEVKEQPTDWIHTRGEYGAQRTRPEKITNTTPINPNTSRPGSPNFEKKSITLNIERTKTNTSRPRRVVSNGPRADQSTTCTPHSTMEYQSSDLYGYYANHELDWYHIVGSGSTDQDEQKNQDQIVNEEKLKKLFTSLDLVHLIDIFLSRGIFYQGLLNMTPQHFTTLGVLGDEQAKLARSLRFVKLIQRGRDQKNQQLPDDVNDISDEILSLQRQKPRFMVSSRQWHDYYRGPYYGQNASDFMAGKGAIKLGHGDSITAMMWGSTLRPKKNGHHYSTDFRRNFIRHKGVTLHSSHIDPKDLLSSLPPKLKTVRKEKERNGPPPNRRGTMHLTRIDAPWANVNGLDGSFRK